MSELETYRDEIDRIDQELTKLVEQRFNIAKKVVAYKKEHGLPVLDSSREDAVIKRNQERLSDSDYADDLAAFYQGLMDVSKNIQKRLL